MLWDGQKIENTLWFDVGTVPDVVSMEPVLEGLFTWWTDHYALNCSETVSLREIVVTSMHSSTGPVLSFSPPTLETGDVSEDSLPNNVALTVSFRTALRGRSFRGRNYYAGLTANQVTGNTVNSISAASIRDIYQDLVTGDMADIGTLVIASRFSGVDPDTGKPIPRDEGVATPVTSIVIVDPVVDSMRRRLPGRGQ